MSPVEDLLQAPVRDLPAIRHRVLEQHIADLERRMAEMERSREMAQHALHCRAHDIATCPRFRAHVQDIVDGRAEGFPSFAE